MTEKSPPETKAGGGQGQLVTPGGRAPASISEAAFHSQVIEIARLRGWLVHAERPARRQSGHWSTPIQGDAGFPDLVMARGGRLVFAELKSARGRVSPEQQEWLDALRLVVQVYIWRPLDWDRIVELLA